MHAYVDAEPGLQGLMVTSTNVHDSLVFGQVLDAGDQMVYEHKAYASQKDRQLLKECDLLERRSRSMFFAQMNTQLLLTKT
ncbi:MAG: hypothetical protein K2X53_03230 [Alphaproteobacteria bacterium]|nr:hypothetical protein [Alphaproteobacteria bacterium]